MKAFKFDLLKNILVVMILAGGFFHSCQDNSPDDNSDNRSSQDSTYSGLEGSREQAGQGGTNVNLDTSGGQTHPDGEPTDSIKK